MSHPADSKGTMSEPKATMFGSFTSPQISPQELRGGNRQVKMATLAKPSDRSSSRAVEKVYSPHPSPIFHLGIVKCLRSSANFPFSNVRAPCLCYRVTAASRMQRADPQRSVVGTDGSM